MDNTWVPKYIERGKVSQYLGSPGREDDEEYDSYKERQKREQHILNLYRKGTPIDEEVKDNYINVT